MNYKRVATTSIPPDHRSEQDNALASIGMRIRKAVAEGYNTGNQFQGFNQANTFTYNSNINYQDPNPVTNPSTRRMPLPNHIEQPPSLTNRFSTFESSSSISDWQQRQTPVMTLPTSNKRKLDRDDDEFADIEVHNEVNHGTLKFNEDF